MSNTIESHHEDETSYLMSSHLSKGVLSIVITIGLLVLMYVNDQKPNIADVVGVLSFAVLIGYVVPTLHTIKMSEIINKWHEKEKK